MNLTNFPTFITNLNNYQTQINTNKLLLNDELPHSRMHSTTPSNQVAKLLLSYKADINAQDESGQTPIFYAIENDDLIMTELLLANKANVKDNPELLNNAVKKECIQIIELLLQHDVDIDASDALGRTALFFTTFTSFTSCDSFFINSSLQDPDDIKGKIAELLLSKGANVNARTHSGQTTLYMAIKKEIVKVIEVLLKYNANVNSGVETDNIPLHIAAKIGNEEIIKMLLNKGADVNVKEKDGGLTALHIASLNCYQDVIEELLKYGANIDAQDDYGRTALHLASGYGYNNVVEVLLHYGSDINILGRSTYQKYLTPFERAFDEISNFCDCSDSWHHSGLFSYEEVCKTLGRHVFKMKAANLYVHKRNLESVNVVVTTHFQVICEIEIAKMKSEKINNASISFYDILAKDTNSLTKCMRNEDVVQILKSDDYKSKFPIYASMIKSYFKKAMEKKELLDQVNEIIYFLFNDIPDLPDDCTDNILSYLSDEDLRIIMDACNKPLRTSNPNA